KNENPNRQGFAHMFEHMMFRGTDTIGPEDYFNLIHGVGGFNNAFTHFDYTAYVNTVPSNQLDLALWLEAERMMFLNISRDGFETERNVVEEERRQTSLDTPYGTIPERLLNVIYKVHPYRWLPIGRIAHLEAAKVDELRRFWDKFYVPSNATLVIVGAVSHERAINEARTYFGWMPRLPEPPRVTVREPEQTAEKVVTLEERLGPVPAVAYAYRTVPRNDKDAVPIKMMLRILAGGESSRLYIDLVKKRKLCAAVLSEDFTLEQDGMVGVVGVLHPVKYVLSILNPFSDPYRAITKAFDAHIETLQRDGVTDHELVKARNQMIRDLVVRERTVNGKAMMLGESSILMGSPDGIARRLDAIRAVTRDDLRRVAREYLSPNRRTVAKIKPNKKFRYDPTKGFEPQKFSESTAPLVKTNVHRPATIPKSPPLAPLLDDIPDPRSDEFTLDNGLNIVVIPDHEVPFVTAVLGSKYGAWTDEPGRPGVASMTMAMLTKGTREHTAEQLADAVEFNALDLYGTVRMDSSTVVAMGLSDKLPIAMDLMAEVVQHPVFPLSELRLLKRRRKIEMMYQEKDPAFRASREFQRVVFGDHPYGRLPSGSRHDIGKIRRASLVEWWSRFIRPDASVLYVGGDVTPDRALELATRYFAGWTARGKLPELDIASVPTRQPTHIYLVDSPGAKQSQIRVGQTGFSLLDPDRDRATVFSQIFGGSFGSRLNKTIRVEEGRTYGAQGGFALSKFGGKFLCSTSTRTESTGKTVRDILSVIAGMRTVPPTDDEMDRAKSYLIGRIPSQYETALDVISNKWFIENNNLPKDYLNRSIKGYKTTGPDDVVRVADTRVDPDRLAIVIVGDADAVRSQLETIAPVTVIH
ncbi:MAG: insulinase family protein, partial [Candidatus Hydrogenedentes bacterium]|nr:insulinase family protein [Candidatus Hydrogenedentota bacterium]